jgi:hypothetical protein
MIPIDSEFLTLYVIYISLLIVLVIGSIYSKKYKTIFRRNLLFFAVYTLLIIIPAFDEDNMKGGNSLFFIVFGWAFVLIHLFVLLASGIFNIVKRK